MREEPAAVQSIIELTQELIRTPSQAGKDDPQNIVNVIAAWASARGLAFHTLEDAGGKSLGGYFHYSSGKAGAAVCLDACIDTCPFGTEAAWTHSPTSAHIEGDVLHGRGVADSKMAVSIFCHIFETVARKGLEKGDLYVLLDADEHTGNFGGVKAFLQENKPIDMAFIGYPGNQEIMIGARGFLRATLSVGGQSAHSRSRQPAKDNALVRAARLIDMISTTRLPPESDPAFSFGPKVTVTAMNGGCGFSQVPDKVDINVDMRLTPAFSKAVADQWLHRVVNEFDGGYSASPATQVSFNESWPVYALPPNHPAAATLKAQAEAAFKHPVALSVCGPSNIGNYLTTHNIPTICGFGVTHANAHAVNETACISSVEPVFKAYYGTIKSLCS